MKRAASSGTAPIRTSPRASSRSTFASPSAAVTPARISPAAKACSGGAITPTPRASALPPACWTAARATKTCPKIFETFGALEFWYLRESPDLVGTDAKADIPLPPNVRRYFFPGTTHGGGRGGFSAAPAAPPKAACFPPIRIPRATP